MNREIKVNLYSGSIMKYFRILLVLLFLSHGVWAGEISVKATVSPEKGTVGTNFKYRIAIASKNGEKIDIKLPAKKDIFPKAKKEKGKKKEEKRGSGSFVPLFSIHGAHREVSESGNLKQTLVTVELSSYRPGKHELPEISIKGSDGISIGYAIPSIVIEELNKSGKEEDIVPPLSLSGNYTRLFILIAVALALLIILFLLFKFLRAYLRRRREARALSPLERFMKEVKAGKVSDFIEHDIHGYVFSMSAIFRKYLSAQFCFDALEMTTDEIEKSMEQNLPGDIMKQFGTEIVEIMQLWDFSKFAEFTPTKERLLQNYERTLEIVEKISAEMGGEE